MKNLLVPVDFSRNAKFALRAAKVIARRTGAKIHLLHSYIPFVPTEINIPINMDVYTDIEQSLKNSLDETLQELLAGGFDASAIWSNGPVADAVAEQAAEVGADLVIIGRTGKGGFLDKLFGSTATSIVKELEGTPVLTIPPDAELDKIEKMVFATRFEIEEDEAITKVFNFCRAVGAKLDFLKLNSDIQPDIQPDEQFIGPLKSKFGFTDRDFHAINIGRSAIVPEIEAEAHKLGADILVVSSRERGFIEELLVDPSISQKLLLRVNMPLLSYRLPGYS